MSQKTGEERVREFRKALEELRVAIRSGTDQQRAMALGRCVHHEAEIVRDLDHLQRLKAEGKAT